MFNRFLIIGLVVLLAAYLIPPYLEDIGIQAILDPGSGPLAPMFDNVRR